ncbi:MAG: hypothetical protein H6838_05025 [Planctomycetes bacterium]|nr:hypothetical protein [Planctomycetota bacterium]
MNFLDAYRLWWLLLVPVLVWLAQPPKPRVVTWTPHFDAVERALAARRLRPPRRSNLRLLLLLGACGAAVAAYGGLGVPAVPGPQRLVVLLDASASMSADDGAADDGAADAVTAAAPRRSRWQDATAQLRTTLAAVPEHVEVTVLRCGGDLLRRHGAFARQVRDLGEPGGAAAVDFVALAAQLPDDVAVCTVTDGQGQTSLPTRGALRVVGGAADNAAVLDVQLDDGWPLPELVAAIDLVAFTARAAEVQVRIDGDAVEPVAQAVTLQPTLPQRLTVPLARRAAGGALRVTVSLPGDPLAADDVWSCVLPPLPAPTIAVLADPEGGPYANVAAEALAAEVSGRVVAATDDATAGLLLVDGGQIELRPGIQRALCFGTRLAGRAAGEVLLEPRVTDWDRRDPLVADLDLSGLRVLVALPETLPDGAPFLFGAAPGGEPVPLAVVAGGGERCSLHFAFRLADSNLPLLPAFPQLLRRAFVRAYGTGASATAVRPALPAGEQDLRQPAAAPDRPLPPFGVPRRSWRGVCLWLALALLALRAWCR